MRIAQRATCLVILMLVLAGGMFGGMQPAGKPQRGDLSLVVLDSTDAVPHYGGQVTFEVATTVTEKPSVKVLCFQGEDLVYWASAGWYPEYPWPWARNFTLSSAHWTDGAAACTAELYYSQDGRRFRTLASITFDVYA